MARVSGFTVDDVEDFSRDLRTIGEGAADMEEAARRIVLYLSDHLGHDGVADCLSVSLHKTHPYRDLPERLQALARQVDATVTDHTACLTRLAAVGEVEPAEPDAHQLVRPLTPAAFDEQPILVAMLVAMGLDVELALDPARAIDTGVHHRSLDMFHVPDVLASEWVADPEAKEQVVEIGLTSLLGMGGGLPNGDLFFVFLFTREQVDDRSAYLLRTVASAIKATLIPHTRTPFAEG